MEEKITIPTVQRLTILGVTINKNLDWKDHINDTYAKANRQFYALRKIKKFLTIEDTHKVYEATIRNTIEYACPVFVGLQTAQNKTLRRIFRRAHRIMASDGEVKDCNCGTFNERQRILCIKLFLKAERDRDHLLHQAIPKRLKNSGRLQIPYCRTEKRKNTFFPQVALLINSLFS